MPQPANDPFASAVLVAAIVALLGYIARMYEKRLADKDQHYEARIKDRDDRIGERDKQIAELQAENKAMAERSTSLATSANKMLDYFLDRDASPRTEDSTPDRGRRRP
jgi:hypothetical protein